MRFNSLGSTAAEEMVCFFSTGDETFTVSLFALVRTEKIITAGEKNGCSDTIQSLLGIETCPHTHTHTHFSLMFVMDPKFWTAPHCCSLKTEREITKPVLSGKQIQAKEQPNTRLQRREVKILHCSPHACSQWHIWCDILSAEVGRQRQEQIDADNSWAGVRRGRGRGTTTEWTTAQRHLRRMRRSTVLWLMQIVVFKFVLSELSTSHLRISWIYCWKRIWFIALFFAHV